MSIPASVHDRVVEEKLYWKAHAEQAAADKAKLQAELEIQRKLAVLGECAARQRDSAVDEIARLQARVQELEAKNVELTLKLAHWETKATREKLQESERIPTGLMETRLD